MTVTDVCAIIVVALLGLRTFREYVEWLKK